MRELISGLRSHPKNKDIYGDAEESQADDLIESIQEVGLLYPPVKQKMDSSYQGIEN